jgi:tetratricopeptide (TPR) repeat protein
LLAGRSSYKLLALAGLLLILSDCSVEKNTSTTRFYHGLTSRFNIYFNGYESFKNGLLKINNAYKDDFSELLKVFENSDPSTVSLCSSDMEKAIQKASKLISLKSITARPDFKPKKELTDKEKALLEQKEFNEWVDDSYFLIAKARFYKHEFNEAASVFSYCLTNANDPEIRTESSVWLARIDCERGNYIEANRILTEIETISLSSKPLKAIYYSALADLFIKQKKFQEAVEPLKESMKNSSGKRTKYRLTYLLAQLYERAGDAEMATSLYRNVVKMHPPYDVEFNARINIAGVFDANSGNPQEIKRELERMLKDSKNTDFQDQIYYALGNLMKKEGNLKEALDYYKKSASSSSVNQNQKGKSYLALADYFYSKPDYMKAGVYYDSTVYFLDQKYPDFKDLKTKSLNLNTLVAQLTVIQTEDSLQKVASMSENERGTLIAGIIAKIIKDESEGKTSEYADRANIGQYYENERRFQTNISQEGKWYFYNQAALTFGRTEFRRRWGDRRLEDNWRRSNRTRVNVQQAAAAQEENGNNGPDTSNAVMDYKKPEFYLKNLPLNDSLLAVSDEKLADAYFNAGKVFSEKISDRQKAAESYEKLLSRFPENELVPETLYELYKVYKEDNNPKSEITRQRLLEKFPESEFSRILSDPDYFNKRIAENKMEEKLYQEAYDIYSLENFNRAITLCDSAITIHPQGNLAPKFMLLRAYSVARISNERDFKEELNKLVKEWPETDEGKKAAELSTYLTQKLPELKIEEDKEIAKEIFTADTTSLYSFAVIIMDPVFNVNQASFDVISYNIDNYTNKNYRTEGMLINNSYVRIMVSGFANNTQAWEYYDAFKADKLIRNPAEARVMTFLINSNNLKALEVDKNPERYYLFFNENYLTRIKNR